MAIRAKFSVDNSELKNGMTDAENQANNSMNKIKKHANSAGDTIKGKLSASTKELGESFKLMGAKGGETISKLGGMINTLSPIALIGTAIVGLGTVVLDVWDKMTLSAEEYAQKLDNRVADAQKNLQKDNKKGEDSQGYFKRLQELATSEVKSNELKTEAINLISILTERYGDLGIKIDKVTGKISGLDEAQVKMLKREQLRKEKNLSELTASLKEKAFYQAQNAVSQSITGEETLNKIGLGFRGATKSKDIVEEVFNKQSIEKQIEFAKKMRNTSNTKTDMDNWQGVLDSLEQEKEAREKLEQVKKDGFENDNARAKALKAATDEAIAGQKNANDIKQKSIDEKTNALKDRQLKLDLEKAPVDVQKMHYEATRDEANGKKMRLLDENNDLANSMLDANSESEVLAIEAKMLKNVEKIIEYKNEAIDAEEELLKIQKEEAKELEKKEKMKKDFADSLNDEAASLKKQAAEKLGDKGLTKELEIEERLKKAAKDKGEALTKAEEDRIRGFVEAEQALSQLKLFERPDLSGFTAKSTNELASRGGFNSSVRMPDKNDVNKSILEQTKRQTDKIDEIKRTIAKLTVVQ